MLGIRSLTIVAVFIAVGMPVLAWGQATPQAQPQTAPRQTEASTRMAKLGYRAPTSAVEPDHLVLVDYLSDGKVAVVTLNRPQADNAITTELAAEMIEALESIAARVSIRVVILTGAGEKAFIAGEPIEVAADEPATAG